MELETQKQIPVKNILELLPPDEGEINIFYGRIGAGKTRAGTENILSELQRGLVVYANWPLNWAGYDERKSKLKLTKGVFGMKDVYFNLPRENFHFWSLYESTIDGLSYFEYFKHPQIKKYDKDGFFAGFKSAEEINFIDALSLITDASLHFDEGHIPFDSYEATRMPEQKRAAIFSQRHFDRKLTIYTQRANSVHVNLRGNANRFFKCEKTLDFSILGKRFNRFQITEFQDLTTQNAVDESLELDEDGQEIPGRYKYAVSSWKVWGSQNIFAHFDSKYLRQGMPSSQSNYAEAYYLTWKERFANLFPNGKENKEIKTPDLGNEVASEKRFFNLSQFPYQRQNKKAKEQTYLEISKIPLMDTPPLPPSQEKNNAASSS